MDDLFKGYGVEVFLAQDEDFLKVKETLTRMGVASNRELKLFQSCHILHKQGRYAIFHFKELFALDGKEALISEDDVARRNTIAKLLHDWKLLAVLDLKSIEEPRASMNRVKVISFGDKSKWTLVPKYSIGKRKR